MSLRALVETVLGDPGLTLMAVAVLVMLGYVLYAVLTSNKD